MVTLVTLSVVRYSLEDYLLICLAVCIVNRNSAYINRNIESYVEQFDNLVESNINVPQEKENKRPTKENSWNAKS